MPEAKPKTKAKKCSSGLKQTKLSKRSILVFAIVFALIGGYLIYRSFAAGGPVANLYVSSSGTSNCTRASTPVDYTTAVTNGNVCSQLETAVAKSVGGNLIYITGGTYSNQSAILHNDTTQLSSQVTVSPYPGDNVTFAQTFELLGSYVHFLGNGTSGQIGGQNWLIYNLNIADDSSTLANVGHDNTVEGLHTFTTSTTAQYNVLVKNTEMGPAMFCYGVNQTRVSGDPPATICPNDPPNYPFYNSGNFGDTAVTQENKIGPDGSLANSYPHDITYDGDYFHDQQSSDIAYSDTAHSGCLFLVSGYNLTLENSHFARCVVYDIQIQDFTTSDCCGMQYGPIHNVTMQNNWFGQPVSALSQTGTVNVPAGCGTMTACETNTNSDGQPALQWGERNIATAPPPYNTTYWQNILLRFNTIQGINSDGLFWNDGPIGFSNVRVIGNVGAGPIGNANCVGVSGLTYSYNAFVGTVCGDPNSVLLGSEPFSTTIDQTNLDLSLTSISGANKLVTPTTGDYFLPTDIMGQTRSYPADAGADAVNTGGGSSPYVSLSASPSSITTGNSSTLTWNSANVTSCTASGSWSGNVATSGSQSTGTLNATSTYNLNCTGANGPASASATVTVSSGGGGGTPTITSFSPQSGPIGTQVTINGTNLDQTTVIQFNQGGTVNYTINSATKITAAVPTGAQSGNFSINFGQATSPQAFTVTASSSKPGDVNGDGSVTIQDLSIVLSHFGQSATASQGDTNGDGVVTILDLSAVLTSFGQ